MKDKDKTNLYSLSSSLLLLSWSKRTIHFFFSRELEIIIIINVEKERERDKNAVLLFQICFIFATVFFLVNEDLVISENDDYIIIKSYSYFDYLIY